MQKRIGTKHPFLTNETNMTYTPKEKKLIALANNGATHAGELALANAATAFFKSISKRRVRYADMVNGADKVRELAAQLNTVHLANMQLLEQLSATQAANIQLARSGTG
jgi:hypothetical protein